MHPGRSGEFVSIGGAPGIHRPCKSGSNPPHSTHTRGVMTGAPPENVTVCQVGWHCSGTSLGNVRLVRAFSFCCRPILLKNSSAVPEMSVLEKVDPLERAQGHAN